MLQIKIDDYSLTSDEKPLGLAIIEFFNDMSERDARILLETTLVKHELSEEDLIVFAACKAYEHNVTAFVTGQDELGMVAAHYMQNVVDNAETYAQSSEIVKILWDCLKQVEEEI